MDFISQHESALKGVLTIKKQQGLPSFNFIVTMNVILLMTKG